MTDIVLSKEQIDKLILIYDQFKYFEDFSVTLSDDGTVSVKFEMDRVDRR